MNHQSISARAPHTHALRPFLPIILAILFTACRGDGEWRVAEGAVWNTTYHITYQAPVALDDSIQHIMRQVEMSLSPFNPSSLISRINRGETDTTDALIDSVFGISQHVNRQSGGRFDPTVSPLVNLWGFGYDTTARDKVENDSAQFNVPQALIDSALTMVGIAECSLIDGKIIKKHPATTFNFSAVTKGFGCDLIGAMLARNGCRNFMVEIGGEITLAGHNPHNSPWRIQIDAPTVSTSATHTPLTAISVSGCGIATSGNYRNFHETARYGRIAHTIDPVSGYPVATDVASATVIAPTAAIADAWATACMASRADSAMNLINREPKVECLLVVATADSTRVITSEKFPL